jgi:hypothetical protein
VTADFEQRRVEILIESWKKTVDVQQHFNSIEMQIRNLGITVVTAAIAAAAVVANYAEPAPDAAPSASWASGMIIVGAVIAWFAFYVMDRWWYHRYLVAAGREAARLEQMLDDAGYKDVLHLSRTIGAASPLKIGKKKMHSDHKIDFFYALILLLLGVVAVVFFAL